MKWVNNVSEFKGGTKEELEKNRRYIEECIRLGISPGGFDNTESYTIDELRAITYIAAGKKLPHKLEQRLLSTKEERMAKISTTDSEFSSRNIEKEFEDFIKDLNATL